MKRGILSLFLIIVLISSGCSPERSPERSYDFECSLELDLDWSEYESENFPEYMFIKINNCEHYISSFQINLIGGGEGFEIFQPYGGLSEQFDFAMSVGEYGDGGYTISGYSTGPLIPPSSSNDILFYVPLNDDYVFDGGFFISPDIGGTTIPISVFNENGESILPISFTSIPLGYFFVCLDEEACNYDPEIIYYYDDSGVPLYPGLCHYAEPGFDCGEGPSYCLDNSMCSADSFCYYQDGTCMGANGECITMPVDCNTEYDPVCGCNGVTYGNICDAHSNGWSVDYAGQCSGNIIYCSNDVDCGLEEFCRFDECTADFGECMTWNVECTQSGAYEPVCGCDAITYWGACHAQQAGVSVDYWGECVGGVLGCTDTTACNYKPDATVDDGSCEYAQEGFNCEGNCISEYCGCPIHLDILESGENSSYSDESCDEATGCDFHYCNYWCWENSTGCTPNIDESWCLNNPDDCSYYGAELVWIEEWCNEFSEGACIMSTTEIYNSRSCVKRSQTFDLNGDGSTNVLDVVSLVNCVLSSSCSCSFDINGDGGYNVLDVVVLSNAVLS